MGKADLVFFKCVWSVVGQPFFQWTSYPRVYEQQKQIWRIYEWDSNHVGREGSVGLGVAGEGGVVTKPHSMKFSKNRIKTKESAVNISI